MKRAKYLQTPFLLGGKELSNNIFYSPLAGCSDFPFRQMAARHRPGLIYCEMVKMDALIRNDRNTFHLLDYDVDMHSIGGQIVGSKPEIAGKAARIIEELGFDVVDLNCGCPVDKVTKDGGGSGLLRSPRLIGDIIAEMVAAVKIPVTVKVRAGWDEDHINVEEITQIAEEAGAVAIAVHGRTRRQAYKGPANWDYIRRAKDAAQKIKVIGNGDIFDPIAAKAMFEQTGCDVVLVSRGTLGNPWIAEDIYRYLDEGVLPDRGAAEIRRGLLDHFACMKAYHNERKVIIDMRRVGCWYIKKAAGTRKFRQAVSHAQTLADVEALLRDLDVEEES